MTELLTDAPGEDGSLLLDTGREEADPSLVEGATAPSDEASPHRRVAVVALLCTGTGLVAGGLFSGAVTPRFVAVLTSLLGVALERAFRKAKSPVVVGLGVVVGVFGVGAVGLLFVGGFSALFDIGDHVSKALTQSDLLRPPIRMTAGYAALMGWLMGGIGFGAAWVAVAMNRPALAMFVPLPIAAITAISVPRDTQLASGLILLVSFVVGLLILSADASISGAEGGVPLRYELRKAMRSVPVIAAAVVALVALAQTDILFPKSLINPALEAQKPRSIPITDAPDRVLFEVDSSVTGPWVMGVLDVYDGTDWRLPPYDQAQLIEIPPSGVVDESFEPGVRARMTVRGLGGAVLPTLPNTVGVVASGPRLNYDARSGNIRLLEGEITDGFEYAIAAAAVPRVSDLIKAPDAPDALVRRFTQAPRPPDAAQALIDDAPDKSKWEQWDFTRRFVLNEVTVSGTGSPVEMDADRANEILVEKEASPFEIVSVQTLLARWIGIPARIGYGFDGGEQVGDALEIRPKDGAVFPEVYFEGQGWLPVIGTPKKTKVTDASDPSQQQFRPGVLPSEDIAVTIFRPVEVPVSTRFYTQLRRYGLVAIAIAALLLAAYLAYWPIRKTLIRGRRRSAAIEAGPHARIAQAYSEWRDLLTDFGYQHTTDTPLMLLHRFAPDVEHNQLAWLVTRSLWGDLTDDVTDDVAADAEELARSLKRRLRDAHPITVRSVATLSKLSLRHPYGAPERAPIHIEELERVAV